MESNEYNNIKNILTTNYEDYYSVFVNERLNDLCYNNNKLSNESKSYKDKLYHIGVNLIKNTIKTYNDLERKKLDSNYFMNRLKKNK